MAATLTKIIDGNPAQSDSFPNALTVRCPRCGQTYRLAYSDEEWHKLRHWQELAGKALRKDHDLRHEAEGISWSGTRRAVKIEELLAEGQAIENAGRHLRGPRG